jgi:hypothetical protein
VYPFAASRRDAPMGEDRPEIRRSAPSSRNAVPLRRFSEKPEEAQPQKQDSPGGAKRE